jgi:putative MATE family efflux protein
MSQTPATRRGFDPRLTEGPILRSLLVLAVPIMGANILQIAYQLIDAFWVGRLGAAAVAAVSISMPILFLLIAAGIGFSVAGSVLTAQYAGARDHAMVDHVAAQTLLLVTVVSFLLGCAGIVLAPYILALMDIAPDVQAGALSFMRVSLAAMPFAFAYILFQALLRGVGQVTVPLYIIAGAVCANFLLDPVLIFGKFGMPALGVTGAAIATMTAQGGAAAIGVGLLFTGRLGIHLRWAAFKPDLDFARRALRLGYPASIEQSVRGLGITILMILITGFGTVATAAYGVGANVLNVIMIPAMGLSLATSTVIGQNLGRGHTQRAEQAARISLLLTFVVLSIVGIAVFALAPHIVRLFVPHAPAVIAEGARFLRIVAWSFGFLGVQFALGGALRASGNMVAAMMISLLSLWVLRFPLAYGLAIHTSLGIDGIWWAFPVSNIATALIAAIWFARSDWKSRKLISSPGEVSDEAAMGEPAMGEPANS